MIMGRKRGSKSSSLKYLDINTIMQNIQKEMPFYNERHFQLCFAIALRDYYRSDKDVEVFVELFDKQKTQETQSKRNYTDVVVYDKKKNNYIAIELKYALTDRGRNSKKNDGVDCTRFEYKKGNTIVSIAKKGAMDNMRYDFLYDVKRLESLKKKERAIEIIQSANFQKGYAILVSNDKGLWTNCALEKGLEYTKVVDTNYKMFCIGNGSSTATECKWINGINANEGANKACFQLSKRYHCRWSEEYCVDEAKKSPPFRYLVLIVK